MEALTRRTAAVKQLANIRTFDDVVLAIRFSNSRDEIPCSACNARIFLKFEASSGRPFFSCRTKPKCPAVEQLLWHRRLGQLTAPLSPKDLAIAQAAFEVIQARVAVPQTGLLIDDRAQPRFAVGPADSSASIAFVHPLRKPTQPHIHQDRLKRLAKPEDVELFSHEDKEVQDRPPALPSPPPSRPPPPTLATYFSSGSGPVSKSSSSAIPLLARRRSSAGVSTALPIAFRTPLDSLIFSNCAYHFPCHL